MNLSFLTRGRSSGRVILPAFILLYFILELINIKLPGLYEDEALTANGALQMIKGTGPFMRFSLTLFNVNFPVMMVEYMTAAESYIILPFLLLFGINVVALRLVPIIFGALTLIVTYLFVKELFDRKAALLTVFLLVINFSFLLDTKLGVYSASMLHFTAMCSLLFLWRWYKKGGEKYFYSGIFLLGLGLSIRVWFLWFICALALLAAIFSRNIKGALGGKDGILRRGLPASLVFGSGILLFIVYNFYSNFSTIRYVSGHFIHTRDGINNLNYFLNLKDRLIYFVHWLQGSLSLWSQLKYSKASLEGISRNFLSIWLFAGAIAWLAYAISRKKTRFSPKRVLFVLLLFVLMLLQTPFTLSNMGAAHFFILCPFVQIIFALAVIDLTERLKSKKIILSLTAVIFCSFLYLEINTTARNNYIHFNRTGGTGNFSEEIFSLAGYLQENNIHRPIVMDWGIYHNLIFISQGRQVPYLLINNKNTFMQELRSAVKTKNTYIFHSAEFTNSEGISGETFENLVSEFGVRIEEKARFYQRDGRLIFIVYSSG